MPVDVQILASAASATKDPLEGLTPMQAFNWIKFGKWNTKSKSNIFACLDFKDAQADRNTAMTHFL